MASVPVMPQAGPDRTPDDLEALSGLSPDAPEALRWRTMAVAASVFHSAGDFDEASGRWMPSLLSHALSRLAGALKVGENPLPRDESWLACRMAGAALERILEHPRYRMVRRHEMVPFSSVRSLDDASIAWVARQPGRTLKQKLSGKSALLAPISRQSTATPENRLVARLMSDLSRTLQVRLQAADTGLYDDGPDLAALQGLHALCQAGLRSDSFSGLGSGPPPVPNNVLLADRVYNRAWRAWKRIRARQARLTEQWDGVGASLRRAVFWASAAILRDATGAETQERLCRPDLEGDDLLVTSATDTNTTWSGALQLCLYVPDNTRPATYFLYDDGSCLTFAKTDSESDATIGFSLAIETETDGPGWRVHWRYGDEALETPWGVAPTWAAVRRIAHHVTDLLGIDRVAPMREASSSVNSGPTGIDLNAGRVQCFRGGQSVEWPVYAAAVNWTLPDEEESEWWAPLEAHRHPTEAAHGQVQSIAEALSFLYEVPAGRRRAACDALARYVATRHSSSETTPIAFSAPDAAPDFTLRDLRGAIHLRCPGALLTWRSVAAATAWQLQGRRITPGDTVVYVDLEGVTTSATVLVARSQPGLGEAWPTTGGIYWERRYVLPAGWFDEAPTASDLADAYFRGDALTPLHIHHPAAVAAQRARCPYVEAQPDGSWLSVRPRSNVEAFRRDQRAAMGRFIQTLIDRRSEWLGTSVRPIVLFSAARTLNGDVGTFQDVDIIIADLDIAKGCADLAARHARGLTTSVDWIPRILIETLAPEGYFHDLDVNQEESVDLSRCSSVELPVPEETVLTLVPGKTHFDLPIALASLTNESLPFRVRLHSTAFPLSESATIVPRIVYDATSDDRIHIEVAFADPTMGATIRTELVPEEAALPAGRFDLLTTRSTATRDLHQPIRHLRLAIEQAADSTLARAQAGDAIKRAAQQASQIARFQPSLIELAFKTTQEIEFGRRLLDSFLTDQNRLEDPRFPERQLNAIKIAGAGYDKSESDMRALVGRLFMPLIAHADDDTVARCADRILTDLSARHTHGAIFSAQLLSAIADRVDENRRQVILDKLVAWLRSGRTPSAAIRFVSMTMRRNSRWAAMLVAHASQTLATTIEVALERQHQFAVKARTSRSVQLDQTFVNDFMDTVAVLVAGAGTSWETTVADCITRRSLVARKIRRIDGILTMLDIRDQKPHHRLRITSGKPYDMRAMRDIAFVANQILSGGADMNLIRAEIPDDN